MSRCREPLTGFGPLLKRQAAISPQPGSASVADLQKTTALITPPKNPGAKGPPKLASAVPLSSVDDEQTFKQHIAATTSSCSNKSHGGPKAEMLWMTMKKE